MLRPVEVLLRVQRRQFQVRHRREVDQPQPLQRDKDAEDREVRKARQVPGAPRQWMSPAIGCPR